MARRKAPRIPDALLDQLQAGADPKTAFDANGLLDDLKKALAERAHRRDGSSSGRQRNRQQSQRLRPQDRDDRALGRRQNLDRIQIRQATRPGVARDQSAREATALADQREHIR
jgi:hypothetical protein